MDNTENQAAKRDRTEGGQSDILQHFQKKRGTANSDESPKDGSRKQQKISAKSKSRAKKFGRGKTIMNTMSKPTDPKKKAISIAELKDIKQQHKNSETSKIIGSIVELKSESDTCMQNQESSPFKLIRSSQDFNIDSPETKRKTGNYPDSASATPTMFKSRLNSDDGISWVNTVPGLDKQIMQSLVDDAAGEFKLPSSPLKNEKDSQSKDIPDVLLDPEIKSLMEKYKANDKLQLHDKLHYKRSISDSNARNEGKVDSSLNDNISKKHPHQNTNNINHDDFSNLLMQIGSKLSVNADDEKENISFPCISFQQSPKRESETVKKSETNITIKQKDTSVILEDAANTSDAFSDDIDMSELLVNATQAAPKNDSDELDDSFSDDDDDILEKVELGLTQPQIRNGRPTTDQTDITEVDTAEVTKNINEININEPKEPSSEMNTIMKYKGMINNDIDDETKNNKTFKLFDENENLAKSALKFDLMTRLQIKNIRGGIFKRNSKPNKQFILQCLNENDKLVNVMVRDHWTSLEFKVNDIIHIIVKKVGDNFQLVDKDNNLLIWNPDTLLTATRIADAVDCKRKALIEQKFNGPGVVSVPLIVGNITHALFQKCLLTKNIDSDSVETFVEEQLDAHIIEIFAAGKNRGEIKNIIMENFVYIKQWVTDYVEIDSGKPKHKTEFKATKILDIEENIISPIYGIKGIIDVVIEAKLLNTEERETLVIPMEIKTGNEYISNRAQVSLYTLLIKQRYNVDCDMTSLVYTKLHQCYLNALKSNDFKLLINIRNELSQYLVYAVTEFPPILRLSKCERCFSVEPCMVLNKLIENGTAEDSGIEVERYEEITQHLNKESYKVFYQHWDDLITKEEGLLAHLKTDMWKSTAEYREANSGNCVSNLTIVENSLSSIPNQFVYMFERDTSVYPPLTSSQLATHDRIILSDQNSTFGLAHGYIKLLRPDIIVIVTYRNWINSTVREPGFNAKSNQVFRSVLTTPMNEQPYTQEKFIQLSSYIKSKSFRIDKDQMYHSMSMARFNLLNLFLPNGDERSRRLIVELDKPKFNGTPSYNYDINELKLNEDQLKAVDVTSQMEDYCLILGMPGTGKTTVIATIVDLIVKSGLTVLITSYTHSAVDNICEKLIKNSEKKKEKLSLLRVGAVTKVSPIVKPYSLYSEEIENNINDKSEFQDIITDSKIVAATCLGINDVVFGSGKRFDYCIIDEASQVTLPVVLGPISFADKFILVGDHYQLPPLVMNPDAKQQGLGQSLFKLLSDTHPQSVIELTHQYRMCSDIMSLSNELIYDGRLKCGSKEVANQKLVIPYLDSLPINDTCIKDILDPERRVVFVNEDAIESLKEVSLGDKCDNPGEARIITTLIKVMIMAGISQESIGVMSFYRAQLRHFYQSLQKFNNIEVLTADLFQGRDKDVIIISLVRSEIIGDLLKEWRRVNVAMTRAKCKLIIFGSKKLLKGVEQFEGFIEMLESNGWFYDLKEGDETVSDEINFLDNDINSFVGGTGNGSNSQTDTQMDNEINSSLKGIKRLDPESKVIRRTKVLKYVIDDLMK